MRRYLLSILLFTLNAFSQNQTYTLDANFFYGSILPHNKDILHLINNQPEGVIVSFNKKTYGDKFWQTLYNYPDYGLSLQYQNNKNNILGNLYGIYAHMNFYFLNRKLQLRIAQGVAYATKAYNQYTNTQNNAYGSNLMPSTYFMLNYYKPNIYKNIGFQTGFQFVHHSNANIKSPNTSTNTLAFNVGLNYSLVNNSQNYQNTKPADSINKKLNYNIFFRSGFAESDIPNSGAKPFYVATVMADKKLNHKSTLQFGTEMFWMQYLKEFIKYEAIVFYENNHDSNADYKRIGVFAGHELAINKLAVDTQIGFYIYDPSKKSGISYQRLGLRYYITPKISTGISLKTHLAQAEALEFSFGYRL